MSLQSSRETEVERILITGVGGFIGSRLAFRFLQEGFFVVGVDDLSNGNIKNVPDGVEFIHGDLAQKSTLGFPGNLFNVKINIK